MAPVDDPLTDALAAVVRGRRTDLGLSVSALAAASGVSRAMINKVERAEAQPTAALLGRLSAALGLTLSQLIARAEQRPARVARHAEQPVWTDPVSGYTRRAVSPPAGAPLEIVDVTLPAGAQAEFAAGTYRFIRQQIWVTAGRLRFLEGTEEHLLSAGDCLQLAEPRDCTFHNPGAQPCQYVVVLVRASDGHGSP